MTERILVTGSSGQIGSELVPKLIERYGADNVICVDLKEPTEKLCAFEKLDVTDKAGFEKIVKEGAISQIYHLASILSATGEKMPEKTWEVNMGSLASVLDFARSYNIRVFWPSSIAAFGPTTPRDNTPQKTVMEPSTMYGVTKTAGELLCNYYHIKYGVDVRSLRYPGLISWKQEPGGGTTDYAVDIFYKGLTTGKYECFVSEDTVLPMMYMDDAISGTLKLMDADGDKLTVRTGYNMAAISFSAKDLAEEVKKHIPELEVSYSPDERQKIANSWPKSIDDSVARADWGWAHEYDLARMVEIMIKNLKNKFNA